MMLVFSYTKLDGFLLLGILTLSAAVPFGIAVSDRYSQKQNLPHELLSLSAVILNICAVISAFMYVGSDYPMTGIFIVSATALLGTFALCLLGRNGFNFIGVFTLWAAVFFGSIRLSGFKYGELNNAYYIPLIVMSVMSVIMLLLGRLIFNKSLVRNTKYGRFIDHFSIFSIIGADMYLFSSVLFGIYNEKLIHASLYAAMIYVMSFYGRNIRDEKKAFKRLPLSLTTVLAAAALWKQPYFAIPSLYSREYALIILLASAALISFIWRDKQFSKYLTFIVSAIAVFIQLTDVFAYGELFDGLSLGILAAAVLIMSFCLKKLRWFALSAVTLAILAVYASRSFWFSLEWWVYLLVCGVLILVIGGVNEYRKKNSKEKLDFRKWLEWWR